MCHIQIYDPKLHVGSATLTSFAHGLTYTPHKFHVRLALWVARQHQPFSIIKDEELIEIFMDLNDKVVILSWYTLSNDVKEIFVFTKNKVSGILKVSKVFLLYDLSNHFISRHILGSFICAWMGGCHQFPRCDIPSLMSQYMQHLCLGLGAIFQELFHTLKSWRFSRISWSKARVKPRTVVSLN